MGVVAALCNGAGDDRLDDGAAAHDERQRDYCRCFDLECAEHGVADCQQKERQHQGALEADLIRHDPHERRQEVEDRGEGTRDPARLNIREADVVEVADQRDKHAVESGAFKQFGPVGVPERARESPVQFLGCFRLSFTHRSACLDSGLGIRHDNERIGMVLVPPLCAYLVHPRREATSTRAAAAFLDRPGPDRDRRPSQAIPILRRAWHYPHPRPKDHSPCDGR